MRDQEVRASGMTGESDISDITVLYGTWGNVRGSSLISDVESVDGEASEMRSLQDHEDEDEDEDEHMGDDDEEEEADKSAQSHGLGVRYSVAVSDISKPVTPIAKVVPLPAGERAWWSPQ